ncbi:hypothetical protein ALC62_13504 [Cyphomyrmex costatus]|uniref:Uncharacterized protein n=1 Tax=Cyphomyrmex costatus TaxID=456900 RepID=A0A151I9W4_9HYME|nr:hypothetical protein ALC62_13504 [Cyphomyrmex costatus]
MDSSTELKNRERIAKQIAKTSDSIRKKRDFVIIDDVKYKRYTWIVMTLNDNKIDYVHWDNPNELVDRLQLLEASRQAGHNAHDNEILFIEELREAGLIIN